jgi:hypothetical protein
MKKKKMPTMKREKFMVEEFVVSLNVLKFNNGEEEIQNDNKFLEFLKYK